MEDLLELISAGNIECIYDFIAAGCDVNLQTEEGMTPLMEAADSGNLEVVKLLVENGANTNEVDVYGNTALMYAAREKNWEIFEYLSLLTQASLKEAHLFTAVHDNEVQTVDALLSSGVNINTCYQRGVWSENGLTVLMVAAQEGNSLIVKKLLKFGANPDLVDEDTHKTALMYAVESKSVDMVHLIIEAGADLNICDSSGKTPLVKALELDDSEIVHLLIQASADSNV